MANKYIEVIEWRDDSGKEMVHRFSQGGEILMGAQLVVMEHQSAVFFRDGKALDVFGPGRHTLTTANVPLLNKLINLPFGGKSPFRAEVYFVGRQVFPDLGWGTRQPIPFRDETFSMINLRAHGKFALKVMDPQLFVNTFVGSRSVTNTEGVEHYTRDQIVARLADVMGENLKSLLDLAGKYDEFAELVKSRVHDDFAKYGLDLTDFYILAITPPEEVQDAMNEKSSMAAIGDMKKYTQFKTARALEEAAQQEGGGGGAAAGAGIGMGLGMGMVVPGIIQQSMQGGQPPQVTPTGATLGGAAMGAAAMVACGLCGGANPPNSRFCSQCGKPIPSSAGPCSKCGQALATGSKFCSNCGTPVASSISCPHCKGEMSSGAKFCPHCGKSTTP